ncbi:unnamed protein product [Closterium sp. Yama58-4]|nr:unnamed protein product [Closterium sp. Yama58-4]
MCLSVWVLDGHPLYALLLASNRDELLARPTDPAHYWRDDPRVLAGRDLLCGGTWLGASTGGRAAFLSNCWAVRNRADAVSRGALISDFLQGAWRAEAAGDAEGAEGAGGPREYLESVARRAHLFNGFNLVAADVAFDKSRHSADAAAAEEQDQERKQGRASTEGGGAEGACGEEASSSPSAHVRMYYLTNAPHHEGEGANRGADGGGEGRDGAAACGVMRVERGLHGLSNAALDTPWSKVENLAELLAVCTPATPSLPRFPIQPPGPSPRLAIFHWQVERAKEHLAELLAESNGGEVPAEVIIERVLMDAWQPVHPHTSADVAEAEHCPMGPEYDQRLTPVFVNCDTPKGAYGTRSCIVVAVHRSGLRSCEAEPIFLSCKARVLTSRVRRAESNRTAKMASQDTVSRKLVVLGIPYSMDTEGLREYMEKFGALDDVIVLKDRSTGRSRGFGYVTFSLLADAQSVAQMKHTLGGRQLEVKTATPKEEMSKGPKVSSTRIFVARVPTTVTEDRFKRYFGAFGNVTDCYMPKGHGSNPHRNIGFVTFDDAASVDKVLEEPRELDGATLAIDRATPKGARLWRASPCCCSAGAWGGGRAGVWGGRRGRAVHPTKIFVGKLPHDATVGDIREYFGRFGPVEDVYLPKDSAKGGHRGFCFVTFLEEEVAAFVAKRQHEICGRTVAVERATPQEGAPPPVPSSAAYLPSAYAPAPSDPSMGASSGPRSPGAAAAAAAAQGYYIAAAQQAYGQAPAPGADYGQAVQYSTAAYGDLAGPPGTVPADRGASRGDLRYRPY